MVNEEEFFTEVCAGFGWRPTPYRLAVLSEWHRHEGMPLGDTWNPLATTWWSKDTPLDLTWDRGFGPGNWNSVPVRVYASPESGIRATVHTLKLDYYPNIRRCFSDQTGYQEAVPEFATYVGSYAYGQALVTFMQTCTADKEDDLTPSEVNQLIDEAIAAKLRSSQLIDSSQIPELVAQILGVHDDTYTDPEVLRTITAIRTKLFAPATTTPAPSAKTPVASASEGGN